MSSRKICFFDVDGVFTPGNFFQSKKGKELKEFGADDWDVLRVLKKYHEVVFLSADKKGFPIVKKRFDEKGWEVYNISNKPIERWGWIASFACDERGYDVKDIIYTGDGVFDYYPLQMASYSFTTSNALQHVREGADRVIDRKGGDRFVAEVCLEILYMFSPDFSIERIGIDD